MWLLLTFSTAEQQCVNTVCVNAQCTSIGGQNICTCFAGFEFNGTSTTECIGNVFHGFKYLNPVEKRHGLLCQQINYTRHKYQVSICFVLGMPFSSKSCESV